MKRISAGSILAIGIVGLSIIAGAVWLWKTTRPAYRLSAGQKAARSGDYPGAERYAELLDQNSKHDEAALLRGESMFLQGQHRQAMGWYQRISPKRNDLQTQAAIWVAQIYLGQKNPRAASESLFAVLRQNSDSLDAHRLLASIYYDQGDFSLALPHLKEVSRLDPTDYRPYRLTGLILKDIEEEDDAIAAYRNALKLMPPGSDPSVDADVRIELAECLLKRFRDAEVLDALKNIDTSPAITLRFESLTALGRSDEANALLKKSLQRLPYDHLLLRLRAEQARLAGDFAGAAADFERVLAADPFDHKAHYQLALAYEGMKQPEKAKRHHAKQEEIRKTLQEISDRAREASKDPWNDAVRFRLAELCDSVGQPKLAQMWRNAAKACRPGSSP